MFRCGLTVARRFAVAARHAIRTPTHTQQIHTQTKAISSPSSLNYLFGVAASAAAAAGASVLLLSSSSSVSCESAAAVAPLNSPAVGRTVYSFGSNHYGCLGVGDEMPRAMPALVTSNREDDISPSSEIVQIVANMNVAGILYADGTVWTFGKGSDLALGHGDKASLARPRLVDGLIGKKIIHLSLSETHGSAVERLTNGETRVWMFGNRALGLPPPPPKPLPKSYRGNVAAPTPSAAPPAFASMVPFELESLAQENIIQVACGKHHSLALAADGRVFSFGSDRHGALGLGDGEVESHTPRLIQSLDSQRIVAVAAGSGSSLFLNERGDVFASGNNETGQAGTGENRRTYFSPVPIRGLKNIAAISAGTYHNFALSHDGKAYGFGWNQSGQLGLGHRNLEVRQPSSLPFSTPIAFVAAGFETTGIVTKDGRLFMQGRGREGQIGRGDQLESIAAPRETPVEVTYFTKTKSKQTVSQVAVGSDFTLALVKEGITQEQAAEDAQAATPGGATRRR